MEEKLIFFSRMQDWERVNSAFGHPCLNPNYKYKRCQKYLLQLEVTDGTQTNEARINVKDVRFAKFRANQLKPIFIYDTEKGKSVQKIHMYGMILKRTKCIPLHMKWM